MPPEPPPSQLPVQYRHWWHQGEVDWPGLIVFTLTIGIALSLVIAMVAIVLRSDHDVSPQQSTLLSTIFGAAIGAVATYIGTSRAQATRRQDVTAQRATDLRTPVAPASEQPTQPIPAAAPPPVPPRRPTT